MTDQEPPRFTVRMGAFKDTWMVWDRKIRGPATIPGGHAINLSEEKAWQLRAKLAREQPDQK
jgi:hypothetical protein